MYCKFTNFIHNNSITGFINIQKRWFKRQMHFGHIVFEMQSTQITKEFIAWSISRYLILQIQCLFAKCFKGHIICMNSTHIFLFDAEYQENAQYRYFYDLIDAAIQNKVNYKQKAANYFHCCCINPNFMTLLIRTIKISLRTCSIKLFSFPFYQTLSYKKVCDEEHQTKDLYYDS